MSIKRVKLPFGWKVRKSKSYPDRIYYFNTNSGARTWEFPDLLRAYMSSKTTSQASPPVLTAAALECDIISPQKVPDSAPGGTIPPRKPAINHVLSQGASDSANGSNQNTSCAQSHSSTHEASSHSSSSAYKKAFNNSCHSSSAKMSSKETVQVTVTGKEGTSVLGVKFTVGVSDPKHSDNGNQDQRYFVHSPVMQNTTGQIQPIHHDIKNASVVRKGEGQDNDNSNAGSHLNNNTEFKLFIGDKDKLLSIQSWINNLQDGARWESSSVESASQLGNYSLTTGFSQNPSKENSHISNLSAVTGSDIPNTQTVLPVNSSQTVPSHYPQTGTQINSPHSNVYQSVGSQPASQISISPQSAQTVPQMPVEAVPIEIQAGQLLEHIWRFIFKHCEEFDQMVSKNNGPEVVKEIELLLNVLVLSTLELRNTYTGLLALPVEDLRNREREFTALCNICNNFFTKEECPVDKITPIQLLVLYSKPEHRGTLEQFGARLEEMLNIFFMYQCLLKLDPSD